MRPIKNSKTNEKKKVNLPKQNSWFQDRVRGSLKVWLSIEECGLSSCFDSMGTRAHQCRVAHPEVAKTITKGVVARTQKTAAKKAKAKKAKATKPKAKKTKAKKAPKKKKARSAFFKD